MSENTEMDLLRTQVTCLEMIAKRRLELLRRMEWDDNDICPVCLHWNPSARSEANGNLGAPESNWDHAHDCPIAAELRSET